MYKVTMIYDSGPMPPPLLSNIHLWATEPRACVQLTNCCNLYLANKYDLKKFASFICILCSHREQVWRPSAAPASSRRRYRTCRPRRPLPKTNGAKGPSPRAKQAHILKIIQPHPECSTRAQPLRNQRAQPACTTVHSQQPASTCIFSAHPASIHVHLQRASSVHVHVHPACASSVHPARPAHLVRACTASPRGASSHASSGDSQR